MAVEGVVARVSARSEPLIGSRHVFQQKEKVTVATRLGSSEGASLDTHTHTRIVISENGHRQAIGQRQDTHCGQWRECMPNG